MNTLKIPKTEYVPHPEGQHEGLTMGLEDKGEVDTSYGKKRKVALKIQSETANTDDGSPSTIERWFTLSSHPKSDLRKFRETMLGRSLTNEELDSLVSEEIVGRRVGYTVAHNEGKEGGTFANITNLWPLKEKATSLPVGPEGDKTDGFPATAEAASAKVQAKAKSNSAANTDWLKSRLVDEGMDALDMTVDDWRELWPSVMDDVPI